MRQVHENELVLYISKSNKFNTAWQKVFIRICQDVLPMLDGGIIDITPELPHNEEKLVEIIIMMLVGHFRRLQVPNRIEQLEKSLSCQTSNYQVCTLVGVLVESSRNQFNKIIREILDCLSQYQEERAKMIKKIEKENRQLLQQIKSVQRLKTAEGGRYSCQAAMEPNKVNSVMSPPKQIAVPYDSSNIIFDFQQLFQRQLREYHRNLSSCLFDLDNKQVKIQKDLINKKEWLDGRIDMIVDKMIQYGNGEVRQTIEQYRNVYQGKKKQQICLQRRFPSRNSCRIGRSFYPKNVQDRSESLVVSTGNLKKSTKNSKKVIISQTPLQIPASPIISRKTQSSPSRQVQKIENREESTPSQRLEYKITKAPLELNIEPRDTNYPPPLKMLRKDLCRTPTHYIQLQPTSPMKTQNYLKTNRISGLLRRNMMQHPHYIQILKDIINL